MRCGMFDDSLKSLVRAFELLEKTKGELGADYDVVKAKFHNFGAGCNFVIGNYQASLDQATEGIKHADLVATTDR